MFTFFRGLVKREQGYFGGAELTVIEMEFNELRGSTREFLAAKRQQGAGRRA